MNRAIIGLGSNIHPKENIHKARVIIADQFTVLRESQFIQTKPVGIIKQPDFINGSILIETDCSMPKLKEQLNGIELDLGRKKTDPRYGPRTIDLDIVIWNNQIVDEHFYERNYLKESVLELIPELKY